jgi:hypothetical protein
MPARRRIFPAPLASPARNALHARIDLKQSRVPGLALIEVE